MAREWAILVETPSPGAARSFGKELAAEGLDVDIEAPLGRIWCFAKDEKLALAARDRILALGERLLEPVLQGPPLVRVWSEDHLRYVDPEAPDEDPETHDIRIDSDLAPDQVRWRVRLELESALELRRMRRGLPSLRRPVLATGSRHIDIGARDGPDADALAARARTLDGVTGAEPSEIRGAVRRWLVRQRLAGKYANDRDGAGHGYDYPDLGGHGGGGGGHGGHAGH